MFLLLAEGKGSETPHTYPAAYLSLSSLWQKVSPKHINHVSHTSRMQAQDISFTFLTLAEGKPKTLLYPQGNRDSAYFPVASYPCSRDVSLWDNLL
ncbi:hypothetical protein AVEN_193463-1, partial [Araneus ventricosus]